MADVSQLRGSISFICDPARSRRSLRLLWMNGCAAIQSLVVGGARSISNLSRRCTLIPHRSTVQSTADPFRKLSLFFFLRPHSRDDAVSAHLSQPWPAILRLLLPLLPSPSLSPPILGSTNSTGDRCAEDAGRHQLNLQFKAGLTGRCAMSPNWKLGRHQAGGPPACCPQCDHGVRVARRPLVGFPVRRIARCGKPAGSRPTFPDIRVISTACQTGDRRHGLLQSRSALRDGAGQGGQQVDGLNLIDMLPSWVSTQG